MKAPEVDFLGDTYVFRWPPDGVELSMERLHEARGGELTAEVTVMSGRDDVSGLLHHARLNLVSTTARQAIVKSLGQRIPDETVDWGGALELACHIAIKRWRDGDPVIDLRRVPARCGSRFLLEPFIEVDGPTILFADGGTGKSMFAMAIGVSIATGLTVFDRPPQTASPVLYLDWEADANTHAERLTSICRGLNIERDIAPIYYRRQFASLAEAAPTIRRHIAELHAGFVIVDSMGAARGGEPESADNTIRLFNAARSLGVPWLGVDHVTKNGSVDGSQPTKPFGSVFTHNLARITWGMERVEDFGDGRMTLVLTNHKTNNGRPVRRHGYEVAFVSKDDQPYSVRYVDADVRSMPGMFERLSLPQQIADVLSRMNKPISVADILRCLTADGVTTKVEHIRTSLNRSKGRFVQVPQSDPPLWGLRSTAE